MIGSFLNGEWWRPWLQKIGYSKPTPSIGDVAHYVVASIPDDVFDLGTLLCRHFKGHRFSLTYDFKRRQTRLALFGLCDAMVAAFQDARPGLRLQSCASPFRCSLENGFRLDGFPFRDAYAVADVQNQSRVERASRRVQRLEPVFSALNGKEASLTVGFEPVSLQELESERASFEEVLSVQTLTHRGTTLDGGVARTSHGSSQALVHGTDRTRIAAEIVSMINDAKVQNDAVYRVSIYGHGADADLLKKTLNTRYYCEERPLREHGAPLRALPLSDGEIMSGAYASEFVHFCPDHAHTVVAIPLPALQPSVLAQGVVLGRELRHGVVTTPRPVCLHPDALVLHGLVSGLNGMGKTTLAHRIASHVVKEKIPVVVFSPDKEWSRLCRSDPDLAVLPLYDEVPLNLVRCPDDVPVDAFYQNLALWLGKAMNAGPYTQPMVKTMLRAFTELYQKNREPTLQEVYEAIEASAKKTFGASWASGRVRLDAYGHNISSALESMRQLLLKANFNVKSGVKIEDCLRHGVVFDSSDLSDMLRPLVYAFLYSQIFSYVLKNFDENARHLRLLVMMEEAHLVFKNDDAQDGRHLAQDLENKLGLLRKRGVGLLFVTHFADQLNQSIRRYAQNKVVFRPDARSAETALDDLAFPMDDLGLLNKAKTKLIQLAPFEAAVMLSDPSHRTHGPVFVKTLAEFTEPLSKDELALKTNPLKSAFGDAQAIPIPVVDFQAAPSRVVFRNPLACIRTLEAIGRLEARSAQEFLKIKSIGKNYKDALDELIDKALVVRIVKPTRTKSAFVYELTPQGQTVFYEQFGEFPQLPLHANPGEHHVASLKAIAEHFSDFKVTHLPHSYADPGEAHQRLGIKPDQAKSRLDLVLENNGRKSKEFLLVEYESGTNNDVQLLTNLTKLVHNQVGLIRGLNALGSMSMIPVQVESYWVAKNQEVKKRLFDLVVKYWAATHEDFVLRVCTLKELLDGAVEESSM